MPKLTRILFSQVPPIPGLLYNANFLNQSNCLALYKDAKILQEKISLNQQGAKSHLSKGHNLPFERSYKLIRFKDTDSRYVNAQVFSDYGSIGHDLTYFMNNENIPSFVQNLVSKISLISHVKQLSQEKESRGKETTTVPQNRNLNSLNWRFTFNVYRDDDACQQAGFDWHKDIAANGDITSITTVHGSAIFQIRPEGERSHMLPTYSIPLSPGSLILLSGESRWNWEHRVLPQDCSLSGHTGRLSLVLGCR
mmetsp:Transcript_29159/g.34364  ORF Transcript_29159/g.34364 Transcript_29159/m.34364 type:complete len:252 (-) Transcript_29159:77-832(-)